MNINNKMRLGRWRTGSLIRRSIYNPNKKIKTIEEFNKQTILSFLKFINSKNKSID